MSIKQRLDLKQGQTLTMTPQLQQAIKLLQMSNLELSEYLETELEKNPLLDRDDPSADSTAQEKTEPAAAEGDINDPSPLQESKLEERARSESQDEHAASEDHDHQFENAFSGEGVSEQEMMGGAAGYDAFATSEFAGMGKGGNLKFEDSELSFENTMAKEKTLREHLLEQVKLEFTDAKERAIAVLLVDYIDESGYFRADANEIAERLGCGRAQIDTILERLQHLDPSGIFARNLSECLALQLRDQNRLDPAMQALLNNLEALASHDLKKLRSLCQVDEEDLKEMIGEIRQLNPKPALAFDRIVAQTVIPDALMKPLPKSRGGGWAVELNHDTLPKVLINKIYYAEVTKNAKAKQDKEYLSDQMAQASWLVKALDQRAETILKVAAEIIKQQEAFFLYGVEYLKPLVLKDVAAAIEMHESTVSRVTTGKYIGTPRGVFEMKYFFTSGVSSTDGAAEFSSEAIKSRIKALIDAETADKILSDDDLVNFLKREGIDIARRTVAKYRESLKIPSSVQRRRWKDK